MTLENAYLLKGFVLAHNAPAAILTAADAVIEALEANISRITGLPEPIRIELPFSEEPESESNDNQTHAAIDRDSSADGPPQKKRKNFSPEVRAAAAERMRAMQARKKAEKEGRAHSLAATQKPFTPVAADKLVRDHSGYAGRRDPDQPLLESDWPDIKIMLNVKRLSVSQIASDYDVPFATLRSFIDAHVDREKQSPGEAPALSLGRA